MEFIYWGNQDVSVGVPPPVPPSRSPSTSLSLEESLHLPLHPGVPPPSPPSRSPSTSTSLEVRYKSLLYFLSKWEQNLPKPNLLRAKKRTSPPFPPAENRTSPPLPPSKCIKEPLHPTLPLSKRRTSLSNLSLSLSQGPHIQ